MLYNILQLNLFYFNVFCDTINEKVSISIGGIFSGGMADGWTDGGGCATISHSSKGSAKIFVNGRHVANFRVPGSASVTV
jgi:hypothetical protein